MERLADDLSSLRQRATLDRTGLSGRFDVQLDFIADPSAVQGGSSAPTETSGVRGPALEVALEEQLGLKLRRARGRVEFLVIRSVERPDEN